MCIRWLYRKLPHLECSGVKALALDLLSVALTLTLTLTLASGDVSMHLPTLRSSLARYSYYEGRSINKSQNGAIPFILKIGKI